MRRFKFLIPVVAAAALLAVPAANAGLLDPITNLVAPTCGSNGHPFSQFGDGNAYYGFSNNGLEAGSSGYTLAGGAYVGAGNEPWYTNGYGSRSLTLPAGASATSPAFCINLFDPAVRMFTRGSKGGQLQIQVVFRGLTGNITGIFNFSGEGGTGSWAPSNRVSSSLALPLLTSYAQIRVTAVSGTWQVDDLFVDPMISGLG